MRLLRYADDCEFSLIEFFEDEIPQYAILSHRWEEGEVTLQNLTDGTGKGMTGYGKIKFCGEQARRDGLLYFWVDTCCIDKTNAVELAEAINSMFRWYRDAKRCYVYLSDVPRLLVDSELWESAFRTSKWFTRGWTLQELIAPSSVEFFSKEGELIGNKTSLERQICDVTRIPLEALRGGSLSDFSITERMAWAAPRKTTRKEDLAYSLLGIFDVSMPLIYGEGREKAFKRLREEIEKDSKVDVRTKCEDFSVPFNLSNDIDITHFIAREAELAEIHQRLNRDGSRQIVVLYGLGGIGKTQLSTAYATRYKESYSAVFWLNFNDEVNLKQSFARIARQISQAYPSAIKFSNIETDKGFDEVVDAVKTWLSISDNKRWLMICDNYDNNGMSGNTDSRAVYIRQFLPESYQGSIIITTRSSQVRIGHPIPIRKLKDIDDSLEILSSVSRRIGMSSDPDAIELVKMLDGLPLALATAGAYLDQVAISISDYIRLYKDSWLQLQKSSPELSSYKDRTLHSTWQISLDYVKQQNKLSAKLLSFWAYFGNQDLWLELLQHSDINDPIWVRQIAKDETTFHLAMRVLSNHGFVEVDTSMQNLTESRGYSLHGCVHAWTVSVLNQTWDYDLARLALKFVASHVADHTTPRGLAQQRLLQHANRCLYMALNGLVLVNDVAWEYQRLGFFYGDQGKLVESEQMYQRAFQSCEKAWGPEHLETLGILSYLGDLYAFRGKPVEAEQIYKRVLQGYEKTWGPKHIKTFGITLNLGILYNNQSKLVEAEHMYQKALQGYKKILGPEHISTLRILSKLGYLYFSQGKLVETEQIYQRVLQGYEKAQSKGQGVFHNAELNDLWDFGVLFECQGNFALARKMYSKALAGYVKLFGSDHYESRHLQNRLQALDAKIDKKGEKVEARPATSLEGRTTHPGATNAPSNSKRHQLLKKLGWR